MGILEMDFERILGVTLLVVFTPSCCGVLTINNIIATLQKLEKKCLQILPAGIDRGRGLLTNLWHY